MEKIKTQIGLKSLNEEYFKLLNDPKTEIDSLIVGRDAFPSDATGIPFHKMDYNELNKKNGSGFYILKGLKMVDSSNNIFQEYRNNTEKIFYDLLISKKVGFINASSYYIGNLKGNKINDLILDSNFINKPVYEKAKNIIFTKSAFKIASKVIKSENNFILENKKIIIVTHPDPRNVKNDEHKLIWQDSFFDYIDKQKSLCNNFQFFYKQI